MMAQPRILVIGIGPHARTFYLPAFRDLEASGNIEVAGVVDIDPQREFLNSWLSERRYAWPRLFLPAFSGAMPDHVARRLQDFAADVRANAVVISTDPLSHKCYALWALMNRHHILMDKPVTASIDAVSNPEAAKAVLDDYEEIAEARARLFPAGTFILCAHRRYHPGFDFALAQVREVVAATGCPVTNTHSYHSDGQWRLPAEIHSQDHHSYHHGHGKISHSGFHFLDMIHRFRKAGRVDGKTADEVGIVGGFVQPDGFLNQLGFADYGRLFGRSYEEISPISENELAALFPSYGEMDVESTFRFTRQGTAIGLASASLLHGGFSRRSWLDPGKDLYKGNGRVKHEHHRIHVGPFLGIQIHSCQAKDNHEWSCEADEMPGGNNHFEIWLFRNTGMIGGKSFERVNFRDLPGASGFVSEKLFIEQVKRWAIFEFLESMQGVLPGSELRSDFSDHRMAVRLMSGLYQSHCRLNISGNPLIRMPWEE